MYPKPYTLVLTRLRAGNLLAPVVGAVAKRGLHAVWRRVRAAQRRERLRRACMRMRAAHLGRFSATAEGAVRPAR